MILGMLGQLYRVLWTEQSLCACPEHERHIKVHWQNFRLGGISVKLGLQWEYFLMRRWVVGLQCSCQGH